MPAGMKVRASRCPGAVPEQLRPQHAPYKVALVLPALSTLPQRSPFKRRRPQHVGAGFARSKSFGKKRFFSWYYFYSFVKYQADFRPNLPVHISMETFFYGAIYIYIYIYIFLYLDFP
jgi:hypothetical protein